MSLDLFAIARRAATDAAAVVKVLEFLQPHERCWRPTGDGRFEAYWDSIANPPCWTIGFGQTGPGILGGVIWTAEQCGEALGRAVSQLDRELDALLKREATVGQRAALISFAYNLGIGALRKSTLLAKFNAGDVAGAAAEFDRWVYAGGVKVQGLINRRADERRMFEGC